MTANTAQALNIGDAVKIGRKRGTVVYVFSNGTVRVRIGKARYTLDFPADQVARDSASGEIQAGYDEPFR